MPSKILLFLDFDGVLHGVSDVSLFRHEEHLARVLRDFPTVEIVISSAWRKTHTLAAMHTFFLTDLRARVIGVTPVFKIGDADTTAVPGSRFHEIKRYLAASGDPARPWLALDDDDEFFPPGCAQLVLCDPRHGFGPGAETRLRAALMALLEKKEEIKMNPEMNKDVEPAQAVNPGPAKADWDEALARSGIDPQTITEYNVPNSADESDQILMGDALAALSSEVGLTDEDAELLDKARDKTPAKPLNFD